MVSFGFYFFLCRAYWLITSYCAGLDISSLCSEFFCLYQPAVVFCSITGADCCLTFSWKLFMLLTVVWFYCWFDITEVPVVAQCMPDTFCFASGLSSFPSTYFAYSWSLIVDCCCVMPPAAAFAFIDSATDFCLSCHYGTTSFLVSDLIAGLDTWGGSWCSVGL